MLGLAGGYILGLLGVQGGITVFGFGVEPFVGAALLGVALVGLSHILARATWLDGAGASGSGLYYLPGLYSCGDASTSDGGDA